MLEFNWKTVNGSASVISLIQNYFVELHASRLQFEELIKKYGDRDFDGMLRLSIKAQCLPGDVGDSHQFLFAELCIVASLFVERGVIAQQVKRICDGFERIVDLVSYYSSHPPHRR